MDQLRNNFDSVPQYEDDQKVHHLYLNASQIAPGCILTSNLERTKVIADTFDKAEYLGQHREYITYTGEKHGVPFSGRDKSMTSDRSAIGAASSSAARFTPPVGLKISWTNRMAYARTTPLRMMMLP